MNFFAVYVSMNFQILPERISKRAEIPCVADSLDKDKLNKVRAQKKLCMDTLKELGYKERVCVCL